MLFTLEIIAALIVGHALWWLYFGLEVTINGAMRGTWDRPYIYFWEDTQRMVGFCRDDKWGGPVNYLFNHGVVPFVPLAILLLLHWRLS